MHIRLRPTRTIARSVALVAVVAAVLFPAEPAAAQSSETVTLEATRTRMTFGTKTRLTGEISPPSAEQPIRIVNELGEIVAETTTDADGHYAVSYMPDRITTVRAQWTTFLSNPVDLKVRPLIKVRMTRPKLFGRARFTGLMRPAHDGGSMRVRLLRNGRTSQVRTVPLRDGSGFRGAFDIKRPGSYRVRAFFRDDDHLPGEEFTSSRTTPLPSLSVGSSGRYVSILERRLRNLGYYIQGVNERYDSRTSDAVIALHKVHGLTRSSSTNDSTWRALTDPVTPRPRSSSNAFHIEIDQTKQVIYTVRDKKVVRILHTSTGAGGATRDGLFHVTRKLAGYSGGGLYYPSYFDGLRAIHGWSEVPTYPASHGCARVPMWAAQWIYGEADIGTPILIYH